MRHLLTIFAIFLTALVASADPYQTGTPSATDTLEYTANGTDYQMQVKAIPPPTVNTGVLLMSSYGCADGWQEGALASEVATYVAQGVPVNNIKCWDNSGE